LCETSLLISKKKHRFGLLLNKTLRKIFGHTRADVRGIRRKLNAELCNLYCSSNISDQIKVGVLRGICIVHGREGKMCT
jgi:hypothetical protein